MAKLLERQSVKRKSEHDSILADIEYLEDLYDLENKKNKITKKFRTDLNILAQEVTGTSTKVFPPPQRR